LARPLRIEFPGALYHVTSRGNAGQAVFLDDTDRESLIAALAEAI
jgi:putative transposase